MAIRSLLLAPGAGADRNSSALVAIDEAVSITGVSVRRMDFPYRKAGRKAPDRAPVLLQSVLDEAADFLRSTEERGAQLALGGRSMGGRICSMAVAGGLAAAGLVLVSYPLHPPGKPDRLRVDHFPQIAVPCLFISGTKDAFGSREELESHTSSIAGPVSHVWIEGGDHGLKKHDQVVAKAVQSWIGNL